MNKLQGTLEHMRTRAVTLPKHVFTRSNTIREVNEDQEGRHEQ